MKQTIRLNERELHRLISESVKRVLNERYMDDDTYFGGGLPDSYCKTLNDYYDDWIPHYDDDDDMCIRHKLSPEEVAKKRQEMEREGQIDRLWDKHDKEELEAFRKRAPNLARTARVLGRPNFKTSLEKDSYGTAQTDKRPLHTPESGNREIMGIPTNESIIMSSVRRAIRKYLR